MKNPVDCDETELKRLKKLMSFERKACKEGFKLIGGVDEAGRGPLAGPVVAAVCILPKNALIPQIDDSKKLTADIRSRLFNRLTSDSKIRYGIGIIEPEIIDQINIYQATIKAMLMAIEQLEEQPDCLLVDGLQLPHLSIPVTKIIKGDQLSQSIAAASIIAKVTRDRLMHEYHEIWPHYGFNRHKGYGTEFHRNALKEHGPCPIHRRSFRLSDCVVEEQLDFEILMISS